MHLKKQHQFLMKILGNRHCCVRENILCCTRQVLIVASLKSLVHATYFLVAETFCLRTQLFFTCGNENVCVRNVKYLASWYLYATVEMQCVVPDNIYWRWWRDGPYYKEQWQQQQNTCVQLDGSSGRERFIWFPFVLNINIAHNTSHIFYT